MGDEHGLSIRGIPLKEVMDDSQKESDTNSGSAFSEVKARDT